MNEPKLQITPKKYTGASSVISMRLPKDLLEDIDNVVKQTGRTRNELLLLCLEFSMEHLEIADESGNAPIHLAQKEKAL